MRWLSIPVYYLLWRWPFFASEVRCALEEAGCASSSDQGTLLVQTFNSKHGNACKVLGEKRQLTPGEFSNEPAR